MGQHTYKLIETAVKAIDFAYTPYSKFRVGSAILTKSGKIYSGCNVENKSYSPTICAERTAIVKAVSEGHQSFSEIVVACEDEVPAPPCGVCLQVLSEFVSSDFKLVLVTTSGQRKDGKMSDFLGTPFTPKSSIGSKEFLD